MNPWLKNLILFVLMLASAGMASYLKPTVKISDQSAKIDLQKLVPSTFGEWREERQTSVQIVDPEQKEMLDKIYNQTLSRTYVNGNGYRVMLSLAYGGDQSRDMQVHRPEVCYASQGFHIGSTEKVQLQVNGMSIPAMRLKANLNSREEPVTYWIRIGNSIVRGNIELGLARVSYGIQGKIPDGLLFRVSSIDGNTAKAYLEQDRFINDLVAAMATEDRSAVIGVQTQAPRNNEGS